MSDPACETCGSDLDPDDNIIGRWCDPRCADGPRCDEDPDACMCPEHSCMEEEP